MHRGKVHWQFEAHTLAKHKILQHYLHAWFPILARYQNEIVYIDGFAGPGRDVSGKEGSPIIALRALLQHQLFPRFQRGRRFRFVFIEKEPDRAQALKGELSLLDRTLPRPKDVEYEVVVGEFALVIKEVLAELASTGLAEAPRFTFVDPFGYTGTPMRVIKRLVETPRSEVLIFFPYPSVERWALYSPKDEDFNEMYASSTVWRVPAGEVDPIRKREGLVELYKNQLKIVTHLAHVWRFEFIDKEGDHYFLMFGTNSEDGLSKMKVAGWSVDKFSGVAYKAPASGAQQFLFEAVANISQLQGQLRSHFGGKGWVGIEQVARFVLLHTDFSEEKHLKEKALRPMEYSDPPLIDVQPGTRRNKGTYPDGTVLRFI